MSEKSWEHSELNAGLLGKKWQKYHPLGFALSNPPGETRTALYFIPTNDLLGQQMKDNCTLVSPQPDTWHWVFVAQVCSSPSGIAAALFPSS